MKVNIENNGKKESYSLINSWSDVTLEKWIELQTYEGYSNSKKAEETIVALSTIPRKLLKQLDIKDIAGILGKLAEFQNKANKELVRTFKIDEVEYGFHPDLDSMTLGEYADLETYIGDSAEKNICEIMAILYRPITEKKGDLYKIAAYDGEIRLRAEEMKKMKAEQVRSALVFFWTLVSKFIEITPSYLITTIVETTTQSQQKVSLKNGDGLE
jgi:hypothetical protein